MAVDSRSYSASLFGLDLGGKMAGYLKKITPPEMKGEKVEHKTGVGHITKKGIANYSHGDFSFSCAMSMGKDLQAWIKASFDNAFQRQDGALIMADFNGEEMRRISFHHALITECSFSNLDAASKDACYVDLKCQAEVVRNAAGKGKVATALGSRAKDWMCSNFKIEIPGVDCSTVSKVELPKFSQKVAQDAVGHLREQCYIPTSLDLSDLTVTFAPGSGGKVEDQWVAAAEKWFIGGETLEEKHLNITVTWFAPDQKTILGEITYGGCGWLSLKPGDMERKDGTRVNTAKFYVEEVQKIDLKSQG
jgi:hypothetical protein